MKPIEDFGKLDFELSSWIEDIKFIPKSAWTFRGDPESYKTTYIYSGSPHFPEEKMTRLIPLIEQKIGQAGYVNRVLLSCVPAHESILPHTDDFGTVTRSKSYHCHVPLITQPGIILGYPEAGLEAYLEPGHLYVIDETQKHYVTNPTDLDRVHLLLAFFPHMGK